MCGARCREGTNPCTMVWLVGSIVARVRLMMYYFTTQQAPTDELNAIFWTCLRQPLLPKLVLSPASMRSIQSPGDTKNFVVEERIAWPEHCPWARPHFTLQLKLLIAMRSYMTTKYARGYHYAQIHSISSQRNSRTIVLVSLSTLCTAPRGNP